MNRVYRQSRRIAYYAAQALTYILPDALFRHALPSMLATAATLPAAELAHIRKRVRYYQRAHADFAVGTDDNPIGALTLKRNSTYFFDLFQLVRFFPGELRLRQIFGDVKHLPERPTVVKSRPISPRDHTAILLPLNRIRHRIFIQDRLPWEAKLSSAVWRGKQGSNPKRQVLVKNFGNRPGFDVGGVANRRRGVQSKTPYLTISQQLRHKVVISIEGVDVATNLKWIMSSNSVCVMPRPRFETWFMEGTLEAGRHYIEVADDLQDLEEKVQAVLTDPGLASRIIPAAHEHVAQFRSLPRERLIALLVLLDFFAQSGQLEGRLLQLHQCFLD